MKREDLGVLSASEQTHHLRDADRMAWLDGHRVYLEIGKTGSPGSGYVSFDGEAWQVRVKLADHQAYGSVAAEPFSTLREAIDALVDALQGAMPVPRR